MVVPIVPGSGQVIEFRVYMLNAEISRRYYYIEFFIEKQSSMQLRNRKSAGVPAFRK
jgi:hypothetical protein